MTQVAEKASAFAAALEKRPQGGPRWLEDLRSRGAARFTALGIPTVRDEEWRFTNVAPIGARIKKKKNEHTTYSSLCSSIEEEDDARDEVDDMGLNWKMDLSSNHC
jgi:hypothetical protein